jgi:hypothetical protein
VFHFYDFIIFMLFVLLVVLSLNEIVLGQLERDLGNHMIIEHSYTLAICYSFQLVHYQYVLASAF